MRGGCHAGAEGVERLYLVVYRNSIWPHDARVDQSNLIGAIQTRAPDTGDLTPFGPEEIPRSEKKRCTTQKAHFTTYTV